MVLSQTGWTLLSLGMWSFLLCYLLGLPLNRPQQTSWFAWMLTPGWTELMPKLISFLKVEYFLPGDQLKDLNRVDEARWTVRRLRRLENSDWKKKWLDWVHWFCQSFNLILQIRNTRTEELSITCPRSKSWKIQDFKSCWNPYFTLLTTLFYGNAKDSLEYQCFSVGCSVKAQEKFRNCGEQLRLVV